MADSYLYKTTERNVLSQTIVELSVEFRGYIGIFQLFTTNKVGTNKQLRACSARWLLLLARGIKGKKTKIAKTDIIADYYRTVEKEN